MKKYVCTICGYIYDEAAGSPDQGIAADTKWEDLPETWVCPICTAPKSMFNEVKEEVKEEAETYLVRIITKCDFEALVDKTVKNLRAAGYCVTSVDQESYEEATGYWIVPITTQIIKE